MPSKDTKKGQTEMTSVMPPAAVATAAPATAKIIGKAVYLELINNPDADSRTFGYWSKNAVYQVILFPEHLDSAGNVKPAQLWQRVVSATTPRSQWDKVAISRLYNPKGIEEKLAETDENQNYHFSFPAYSSDEYKSLTDKEKFDSALFTLETLLRGVFVGTFHERTTLPNGDTETKVVAQQGWIVRNSKPLVVEITDEDAENVDSYTTPQALIRRIQKARVSVGFPEKLV